MLLCSSRLTDSVKQHLDKEKNNASTPSDKQWKEYVDLWTDSSKLGHLWKGGEEDEEAELSDEYLTCYPSLMYLHLSCRFNTV